MSTALLSRRKVPELSGLEVGQDAVCFAALAQRLVKTARTGSPYLICTFKDRFGSKDFFVWSSDSTYETACGWRTGEPYRLTVRSKSSQRGVELSIVDGRPVDSKVDVQDGYDVGDLYETSRFDVEECFRTIRGLADAEIKDPPVRAPVLRILDEQGAELKRMPAAQAMHHAFTGGLIEHLRSMTRVSVWLGRHYAKYYEDLVPPINLNIVAAAAILHDIGKLVELRYNPIGATYTTVGRLVGHIIIGRDLVRRVAGEIPGFPEATLLGLEHAILAHHGRQEYGSPVVPQTIEALIVSMADDLDAKVNQAARARMTPATGDPFTDDIPFADGRRRFYRGVPAVATGDTPAPDGDS